jgi:hypothetical protein
VKRKQKYINEISKEGLDKVALLVSLARRADLPTPTASLLRAAGLRDDPHTGRGALKMVEALGLIRSARGSRKTLLWQGAINAKGVARDPKLPDLLPFRRLRDLLQHYRGSLISTWDLRRDAALPHPREALGALKALAVLDLVEIGKINSQTVGWTWLAGRGLARTYQRGYFGRLESVRPVEDGPRTPNGEIRWPWIDEVVYREWRIREEGRGYESITGTDGLARYRPPTADGELLGELVVEIVAAMPVLQRQVIVATLLQGLAVSEIARLLEIPRRTVNRLLDVGLHNLRSALTREGLGPSIPTVLEADSLDQAA